MQRSQDLIPLVANCHLGMFFAIIPTMPTLSTSKFTSSHLPQVREGRNDDQSCIFELTVFLTPSDSGLQTTLKLQL